MHKNFLLKLLLIIGFKVYIVLNSASFRLSKLKLNNIKNLKFNLNFEAKYLLDSIATQDSSFKLHQCLSLSLKNSFTRAVYYEVADSKIICKSFSGFSQDLLDFENNTVPLSFIYFKENDIAEEKTCKHLKFSLVLLYLNIYHNYNFSYIAKYIEKPHRLGEFIGSFTKWVFS